MSWEPVDQEAIGPDDSVETVIVPRSSDLGGGFKVMRALPSLRRRMVGPFVFFDQMGPALLGPGEGLDVAPHPHIGLATVTYLFTGELEHRDSLGVVQSIQPGAVNWMTAGSGIVHSERTPAALRPQESPLFGIQSWVALPERHEEAAPTFEHRAQAELPLLEAEGKRVRLIAGSLYGARAPVPALSDMFYADASLEPGARLAVPAEHEERAVFIVDGSVEVAQGGDTFSAGQLVVFRAGAAITLRALKRSRLMLLGGEPMEGPRYIWWNFVSSSRERIEQAKEDWKMGRFQPVPEETEFIPLPEGRPKPVRYP